MRLPGLESAETEGTKLVLSAPKVRSKRLASETEIACATQTTS